MKKRRKGLSQGQGKFGFLTVCWTIFSSLSFLSLLNLIHFHVSNYHLLQMTPKISLSIDLSELQTHKYNYLLGIAKWRYLKTPQIHSLIPPLRFASLSVFSITRHQGVTLETSLSSSPHHSSSTFSPKYISNTPLCPLGSTP